MSFKRALEQDLQVFRIKFGDLGTLQCMTNESNSKEVPILGGHYSTRLISIKLNDNPKSSSPLCFGLFIWTSPQG